jgi:hypothetical protein
MKEKRLTVITCYGERDPAWTGPREWVEIGHDRRTYTPAPASRERLRRLPLRFVAYKGNLPGKPSGERKEVGQTWQVSKTCQVWAASVA